MKDLRRMAGLDGTPPNAKAPSDPAEGAKAAERILASDPDMAQNVRAAFERYEGKSSSELMSELERGRAEGAIDMAELARVAERLSPMLSEEQRQRMEGILSKLR